ncbi:hypothetical protein C0995_014924 [Termitomyces sp. Mi166|nr:hypothetical protein C0995_014924 [Termitomyces sp. Mi166\
MPQDARMAESAFIVNAADILELSSVKTEGTSRKWVNEAIKHALAASKDVPTIKEALYGTEKHNWSSATELAQIKKLSTWDVVEALKDANNIPYCYILHSLHGSSIKQADIKNAYLNASLKENKIIHMQFSPFYH